jgi:hypothetical protein
MLQPFQWGSNGQQLTPNQVKILRELAAAKADKPTPKNLGEGLASVGDALMYVTNMNKANEAETAGMDRVAQALTDARASGGADGYYDVLADPWATEGQRLVAGGLLDRMYSLGDRAEEWARQDALRSEDRANTLGDRQALWDREDTIRDDERAYNQPMRDAQITSLGLENEAGQLGIDQMRKGFRPLVTPEERASYGIDPADTSVWQAGSDGRAYNEAPPSSATSITVNTGEGQDGALNKALSTKEGESWATVKDAGMVSGAMGQDLLLLDELIKIAPQGPIVGPLAETFKGFSSAGDAFQSIVKRVAPSLRTPGSGATSDIEYQGFLDSLASLKNTPEANRMINSIMKAKAAINVERSNIVTRYQAGEIDVATARAEMARLNSTSIITPEMKQALAGIGASGEGPAAPEVGDVVEGYVYQGGDPASPSSWKKP